MRSLASREHLPILVLAAACVLVLVASFPGSASVLATEWAISAGDSVPGVTRIADAALIVLAIGTAVAAAFAWFRHPGNRPRVSGAAIGVVAAYGLSELLKLVFAQPRPCTRWAAVAECPAAGDWSLPSNHATLAFGAVVVIAFALRSWWITTMALAMAIIVAAARVFEGVHYLHDVAIGALLGLAVTGALGALAAAFAERQAVRRSPARVRSTYREPEAL
ncbi:phosphatase PAP2 family protein [Humidisolicoccus flavus]|uniref:phosphatase PAP2 family protein n=1 Tax=Humidisolicoccus flavus TaxID=3111414 RepID=UPI00324F13DB